jgi:hypothetical protein
MFLSSSSRWKLLRVLTVVIDPATVMRVDASGECGNRQSLCVVNDQPVGNPKRKV